MASDEPRAKRKLPIVPLAILAVAGAAAAFFILRGVDYRAAEEHGLRIIRGVGPWVFFAACAVLPAFGAPLTVFTITAGEVFAPLMTLGGVIVATMLAIGVNLAFTYWLARYALRPLLSRIAGHYGYRIPRVTHENARSVAIAIRLTPGPPFAMQSYILGLAETPFRTYMVVSWICILPWALGAIILGRGILNGNFKLVLYGMGVIVVATVVIQAIRKRYAARVN
jgi:uncharacterized membrane protein YdjX (TVP38/TMEM64 family)